jgi:hypothetical protein
MKKSESARVVYYRNSLHYLLNSGGGTTREQAVAAAHRNVESLAVDLLPLLHDEISQLEELVSAAPESLTEDVLREIFHRQSVIYNLAGTFGCESLLQVSASLGDLLADMIEFNLRPKEPIHVHVRAARMFALDMPPVLDEAQAALINHLAHVREFLRSEARGKSPV